MTLDLEKDGGSALDDAARVLASFPSILHTCHCTGMKQYERLRKTLGDRLHYLSGGGSIVLP